VGGVRQVIALPATRSGAPSRPAPVLVVGVIAFAAALTAYLVYVAIHPLWWMFNLVDLRVYLAGGLIVRHVEPVYNPHLATPLYSWQGYPKESLLFTYPPFAAVAFAVVSFIPWSAAQPLSVAANIVLLLAALWVTFRALGYRNAQVRLGATLLTGAVVLWTEPVLRTLYFGQVNIALMALILWDLTQPDTRASRWWKGAGVGIAAGIKLVPLIFIPYLLLARKFRQAAVAAAAFGSTIVAGFVFLPADSRRWWLHGLFLDSSRTGFIPWGGGQSLRALLARTMDSVAAAQPVWLVAAVLVGVVGIACAAVLDLAGHQVAGILACALTGLLVSPVTWDHHWVWVAPAVAAAASYAIDAMRADAHGAWWRKAARWPAIGFWALAAGMVAVYGAWPDSLWNKPWAASHFAFGLTWVAPNSSTPIFVIHNNPAWKEYHWTGWYWLGGNSLVLGGLVLLAILVLLAVRQRPGLRAIARSRSHEP
jgi:alpha-1,2-mannosyltransferase